MTEPTLTETTLALYIQEGRATDPVITTALVKQYAPAVQRFTLGLLNGRPDATEVAHTLTRQTFATALNQPDSFSGKDNIRAWLLTQAWQQTRALPTVQQSKHNHIPAGGTSLRLDTLSHQEYLALLLRYDHRLPLADIAQLLHTSENKIHKLLSQARQKLIQTFLTNQQITSQQSANGNLQSAENPAPITPSHYPRETQRLLDGLLDPETEITFRDHVDTCPDCRTHLKQFSELEFHLNTLLYHDTALTEEKVQSIVQAVINREMPTPKRTWKAVAFLTHLPIREMSWVLGAAVAFFILARWLNPFFASPPPPTTPTPQITPTLPRAQNLSTVFRQDEPVTSITSNVFPGQHVIWSLTETRTGDHIPTTPIVFSRSGMNAIFGAENQIILWGFVNKFQQIELNDHQAVITALGFSADEVTFASGDEAGNILIWKRDGGIIQFRLEDHPGAIRSLAFSPDGRYLAVGLSDGFWLWEIQEKSIVRVLAVRWETIRELTFSPDSQWLAIADDQDTIAIWGIPKGQLLLRYETLPNSDEARLDNETLSSPDMTQLNAVTRLAFSPDGRTLASGSFNGAVEIVALSSMSNGKVQGTRLYTLQHPAWISEVQWSPDGTQLATISDTGQNTEADSASRAVFLWDAENGVLAYAPLTGRIARGMSGAVFGPNGHDLWVSNFDGSLFHWEMEDVSHLVAAVPEPQFFTRTSSNLIEELPPEVLAGIEFTDLAQASLVGFAPITLSPLPLQFTFVNGHYSVENARVEMVYQARSGNTIKIIQRQIQTDDPSLDMGTVGASAVIQPMQINGTVGEYVMGSWVQTYPDNFDQAEETPIYRWQGAGGARLRWIQSEFLMEIQTSLFQYDEGNLPVDDLLSLAENLVAQAAPPILLTHTVEDGETCIGIAFRYGTTVGQIIQANGLENCDLIVSGQPLLVPLPNQRETVAETDLNCDGVAERIRAIPDPNHGDLTANFGVVVEAIPPRGDKFWPVWQLTIADVPVVFFGLPTVQTGNECESFLVVNVYGGTEEFSGSDMYVWNGEEIVQVLDAVGFIVGYVTPALDGSVPYGVITQSLVRDFVNGGCTRTRTTYTWNDSIFIQTEQTIETGVDCLGE